MSGLSALADLVGFIAFAPAAVLALWALVLTGIICAIWAAGK